MPELSLQKAKTDLKDAARTISQKQNLMAEHSPRKEAMIQPMGNQAMQRMLLKGVQAKLKVSQPGDQYEQEADRVAEMVMRMPNKEITGLSSSIDGLQRNHSSPLINRSSCPKCYEDEKLHRKTLSHTIAPLAERTSWRSPESNASPEITPEIESQINSLQGMGQPLPQLVRSFFEPRFGYNFGQVRIHTDTKAAELAQEIGARAYTIGKDIAFGIGQYRPDNQLGRELLAHELSHVLQQDHSQHMLRAVIQRKKNLKMQPEVMLEGIDPKYAKIKNEAQALSVENIDRNMIPLHVRQPKRLIQAIEEKDKWLTYIVNTGKFGPRVYKEIAKNLMAMDDALWNKVILEAPIDPETKLPLVEGLSWDARDPLAPLSPFSASRNIWARFAGEPFEMPKKPHMKKKIRKDIKKENKVYAPIEGPTFFWDSDKRELRIIPKSELSTEIPSPKRPPPPSTAKEAALQLRAILRESKEFVYPPPYIERIDCLLFLVISSPEADFTYLSDTIRYFCYGEPTDESSLRVYLMDFRDRILNLYKYDRSDDRKLGSLVEFDEQMMKIKSIIEMKIINPPDLAPEITGLPSTVEKGWRFIHSKYYVPRMTRIRSIWNCYNLKRDKGMWETF